MAADDFNENDQVDLNSEAEAPAEVPAVSESDLDAAYNKFFNKATKADLEDAGVSAEELAAEKEAARSNKRKSDARKAEQKQELREEGLEAYDELDEEAGEEDVPAIKDNETGQEEEVAKDEEAEKAPSLDPNLRFAAATLLGWSDEKIDKLYKADPELAAETIQQLTEQSTNLSRQLLTAASQPNAGTQQTVATPPAQPAAPASKLDEIYANMTAFAEANGEELAEMFKALKTELIDPWRAEQAKIEVQKTALNQTEARQTFGTLSTKFTDLYGEQGKPRSQEQQKAVSELAEVADQLRAGAKLRGQELSISDAINRAHLLVSHNYREQAVRKSIKEQVQTRAKGITNKPTYRTDPVVANVKSRDAAKDALRIKAAELGISGFDED